MHTGTRFSMRSGAVAALGALLCPKFRRGADSILVISLSLHRGHVTNPRARCAS